MRPFYFKPNIHHANINNEITILDEISDRYILLSELQTKFLEKYMNDGEQNSLGNYLYETGIISSTPGTQLSSSIPAPQGVGLLTWNSHNLSKPLMARFFYLPEAVVRLIMIRNRLKTYGLHSSLDFCRNGLNFIDKCHNSIEQKIILAEKCSQSIKLVAPFLSGKVKCLEFSLTLFDMLLSRNVTPSLYIGYQRYDFLSHAWIEVENTVIADDQNLRKKLTPIISVEK